MCIRKTGIIILKPPVDQVFSLFGPVEETKWAHDWQPIDIIPEGAVFEQGMHFKTRSNNSYEDWFMWELNHLSEKTYSIRYVVKTDNRTWVIEISCNKTTTGSTSVTVTYTYKALNELGDKLNHMALRDLFKQDLKDWEDAIHFYLATGVCLNKNQYGKTD